MKKQLTIIMILVVGIILITLYLSNDWFNLNQKSDVSNEAINTNTKTEFVSAINTAQTKVTLIPETQANHSIEDIAGLWRLHDNPSPASSDYHSGMFAKEFIELYLHQAEAGDTEVQYYIHRMLSDCRTFKNFIYDKAQSTQYTISETITELNISYDYSMYYHERCSSILEEKKLLSKEYTDQWLKKSAEGGNVKAIIGSYGSPIKIAEARYDDFDTFTVDGRNLSIMLNGKVDPLFEHMIQDLEKTLLINSAESSLVLFDNSESLLYENPNYRTQMAILLVSSCAGTNFCSVGTYCSILGDNCKPTTTYQQTAQQLAPNLSPEEINNRAYKLTEQIINGEQGLLFEKLLESFASRKKKGD